MSARRTLGAALAVGLALAAPAARAEPTTAESPFRVTLPPHHLADQLPPDSPFGDVFGIRSQATGPAIPALVTRHLDRDLI